VASHVLLVMCRFRSDAGLICRIAAFGHSVGRYRLGYCPECCTRLLPTAESSSSKFGFYFR
jgi:hypothetical protein